jgi:hypothetical protein
VELSLPDKHAATSIVQHTILENFSTPGLNYFIYLFIICPPAPLRSTTHQAPSPALRSKAFITAMAVDYLGSQFPAHYGVVPFIKILYSELSLPS